MDLLTHLFLPVGIAYALRPDLFPAPRYLLLGVCGVVPDADKLVGLQGVLHSAVTLGVISVGLALIEERLRGRRTYALLAAALLFSHLLLDILDGGPVPLLAPFIDVGIGLSYPAELVIGERVTSTTVQNPLPSLNTHSPSRTRTTYPILSGYGVLSMLVFVVLYVGNGGWRPESFRD